MFKITIGCIPPTGLNVETTIAVEPLNERLRDTSSSSPSSSALPPIVFTSEPLIKLRVSTTHAGAEARGEMVLKLDQECARCCDFKPRELTVPIHLQLRQAPMSTSGAGKSSSKQPKADEDLGIIFFRDDHADIEPVLHELALVALDIFWKPELKADGSCSLCALNFRGLISSDASSVDDSRSDYLQGDCLKADLISPTTSNISGKLLASKSANNSSNNPFKDLLKNNLNGKLK